MSQQSQSQSKPEIIKDNLAGCLMGLAVGDALGAPHEFQAQRSNQYTGKLYLAARFKFQYADWTNQVGQYTDDTEMTLYSLRSIIEQGQYDRDSILNNYMKLANDSRGMGKNTRELFKGVKTIKGYAKRWAAKFENTAESTWTQSNGSLMRCSLLSFLNDNHQAVITDCKLSNPSEINISSNLAYCKAIKMCATKLYTKDQVLEHVLNMELHESVLQTIKEATQPNNPTRNDNSAIIRDLTGNTKGWVLNALYCAFYGWYQFDTYQQAIDTIIKFGGDTDTNAAIAGALIGATIGYDQMMKEDRTAYNINIIRNLDLSNNTSNPRPIECSLADFDELIDKFYKLL